MCFESLNFHVLDYILKGSSLHNLCSNSFINLDSVKINFGVVTELSQILN